jgi:hypothetical protein
MNAYVFLHRHPIDEHASPIVLTDLNSALEYPNRVSDVMLLSLQEFGARSARAIADDLADIEAWKEFAPPPTKES